MLKRIGIIDNKKSVIYVVQTENDFSRTNDISKEDFLEFLHSEKEFNYNKTNNRFVFFIKHQEDLEKMRLAGHKVRQVLDKDMEEIFISGSQASILALAEGLVLSNYQFLKYFKDADQKEYALDKIYIEEKSFSENEVEQFNNLMKSVYWSRDMVNEPYSYLNAVQLAKELQEISEEANIKVEVLEREAIEQLKMGGLLAVNKGSLIPPTFTIMEYKPENPRNSKPIVLVGKGVVYDTGGLSLKPTPNSMDLMKSDMGGAACMAGTIYAAALNKLDVHLIALIPATDNRPGGDAYAPGDIVTMYDGTTVEVLNTDAEGRMILADAIAYASKFDPELIIDAATLTGAALVAAGTRAICMMSNASESTNTMLIQSGVKVYERLVPLPLWDDYKEQLKSSIADLKNIGGRYAGTITAGKFLEHFTKHPFIHLDIAGPAFNESPENYKGLGGSGVGVRLLADFLSGYKSN